MEKVIAVAMSGGVDSSFNRCNANKTRLHSIWCILLWLW